VQVYCFTDTVVNVMVMPPDGTFYLNGVVSAPVFNPAVLGTGTHELFYTRGSGVCASEKRVFITVLFPIDGEISPPDSVCLGDNAVVAMDATGGTGTLTADWDNGLGFGFSHIVRPAVSTIYTVTVTDGCSQPYVGSASVYVYPPFEIEVVNGPPVCYDDTSWVEIVPPNQVEYEVSWLLDTLFTGTYLEGQPGIYLAEVLEILSGCRQAYDIPITGPPPLSANFILIPNQPCIDIIHNTVQVIDLSTGYTNGMIDFGDGTGQEPYVPGQPVQHAYTTIGEYMITLIVTNDLGCSDTLTRNLCVENRVVLYVPNAFSPNGDGVNDVLKVEAAGVGELHWTVFNRFGETVFESTSTDTGWDGTYKGQELDPEVFVVHVMYTDTDTGQTGEKVGTVTLVR
jgi:gliding motility-associated-like protein